MGLLDDIGAPPTISAPAPFSFDTGAQQPTYAGAPPQQMVQAPMAPAAQQDWRTLYPGLKKPPPPIGTIINGTAYVGGDPRSTSESVWKPVNGDEYLSSLPIDDDKRTLIKMLANYEAPASGNRGVGSPEVQQLVGFAKRYDPTFDVKNYKVRQDTLHDFNNQKANGTLQALNNAAMHLKSYDDEVSKLGNWNYLPQIVNRALNYMSPFTATQKAVGSVNETSAVLAPEIAKVAQGGAPTVEEVSNQADNLDMGARPNVEAGVGASMAQKIGDRLLSIQAQWRRAFGNTPPKEPLLTPQAALATHQLLQKYSPDYEKDLDYTLLTAGGFSPSKARSMQTQAPPSGVDALTWSHMTPQEKALWH